MKGKQIKVGGLYIAKISGRLVPVRVDAIREHYEPRSGRWLDHYDVTNTVTKRTTTFRSPQKFRQEVTTATT